MSEAPAMINDAMIEKAATSDAAFDGRDLSALGAADRRRYRDRAHAALTAALPLILEEVAKGMDAEAERIKTHEMYPAYGLNSLATGWADAATAIRAMGEKANGRALEERETSARKECERRGIDPDEICADGGVLAWMVVDKERKP